MWKVIVTLIVIGIIASAMPISAENVYEAWVARYDGPGMERDEPVDIAVDKAGNVYVTGSSVGMGTGFDFVTIKYSPQGDQLWSSRYNGIDNQPDEATAIAVDDSGNVYVTGWSSIPGNNSDYLTIKYSSLGETIWTRRYNGAGSNEDQPVGIALDQYGNVYVAGSSYGAGTFGDIVVLKYTSSGNLVWSGTYNSPGNGYDVATGMAFDKNGYIYVAGHTQQFGSEKDYLAIKYSQTGETLWARMYNGPGDSWDEALALTVDQSGNAFITGQSYGSGTFGDYATIKYTASGDTAWARRYDDPDHGIDEGKAVVVDQSGNVYVTGWGGGIGLSDRMDYATFKYTPSGESLWLKRFNGTGNLFDGAMAMTLDTHGNVYATGYTTSAKQSGNVGTVKYSPEGELRWAKEYDGPDNQEDAGFAMAADESGNIYVTGYSVGLMSGVNIVTIKYSPCTPDIPKAGDANADGKYTLSDVLSAFNYIFHTPGCSPLPSCWLSERLCRGDWNGDGRISIVDVVQGVNYVFNKPIGGPWNPIPSVGCCP